MSNIIDTALHERLDQEYIVKEYWESYANLHGIETNRQRRCKIFKYSFFVAARELTSLSLSSIGGMLDKDHATVLHAIRNHALNYSQDTLYQTIYNQIYDQLSARMDEFNDGINKVLSKRIERLDAEVFSSAMIKMYKTKLEKQRNIYEMKIEALNSENTILKKHNKSLKSRSEKLNAECLRLKNLL